MGTLKLNNVTAITESGGAITYAAGTIPDVKLTPTATASAPSGVRGALYYDSDKETLMQHNGTDWIRIREEAPTASGGIITEHGIYRVHTFLSSGIFTVLNSSLACNILIVAGGGAGGCWHAGGGGAGGMHTATHNAVVGSHNIIVGHGGTGGSYFMGTTGGNSSAFGNMSAGGGRGGTHGGGGTVMQRGSDGGSGGEQPGLSQLVSPHHASHL